MPTIEEQAAQTVQPVRGRAGYGVMPDSRENAERYGILPTYKPRDPYAKEATLIEFGPDGAPRVVEAVGFPSRYPLMVGAYPTRIAEALLGPHETGRVYELPKVPTPSRGGGTAAAKTQAQQPQPPELPLPTVTRTQQAGDTPPARGHHGESALADIPTLAARSGLPESYFKPDSPESPFVIHEIPAEQMPMQQAHKQTVVLEPPMQSSHSTTTAARPRTLASAVINPEQQAKVDYARRLAGGPVDFASAYRVAAVEAYRRALQQQTGRGQ